MKPSNLLRSFLLAAGSSLLAVTSASAQSGSWLGDSAGNWSDTTKWTTGTVADGADNTATFGNVITADRIITLDGNRTIGNITASDTGQNYTISGANILTLDRTDATKPTISVTQSGRTLTIGSVIAGNDGLLKSGAGTLLFNSSSNNTFTGGFDISGGVVSVNSTTHANAFGASTNVIRFTGNGTIHNTDLTYTIAQAVAVNNGVIATFRGANQENTIVNGIVSGSGEIRIQSDSNTTAASFANTANTHTGTLWVGSSGGNALNFTANSLADSSTGTLKVGDSTGAINFTLGASTNAPVTLTNRAVELAGTTGAISLNNSATSSANIFTIARNLTFTTSSSGNKTLTLGGTNTGANAFNGSIGNNGASTTAIRKADGGTWILTNASNSYTGGTNITGGTLGFASGALGSSGAINASGGTLLWLPGNTQDISSRLAFTGAATSTFNTNGNDVTFASAIGSSTNGNFVKTGLGTLTLQGSNTFTTGSTALTGGGTLVLDYGTNNNRKLPSGGFSSSGGTIVLKGGSATESSTSFTTSTAAGTFFVRDTGTSKINLNGFSLTSNQAVVSFSDASMATTDRLNDATGILGAQFTVGDSWATSAASGTDINIVKYTGATTFTPAAATTNATNYELTGGTTLTATRQVNTLRIVGNGNDQVLSLGSSGGFNLQTSNFTTATGNPTVGGLLYAGGGNDNYTISSSGTSTGRLLIMNGNGQTQHVNVFKGTLNLDVIVGNGSSSFQKTGEGTLVFNKANGYTGATRVYQGVLRVTGAGTLTAGTTVQGGAAIELGNGVAIGSGATLNITGTGISNDGALRNVATTSSSYAAAITIGSGGARINSDSGTLTLTGGVVTAGNTVTFGGAGNTTVATAAISGSGGLIKDGTGTTTLSATNSYTGATNVNDGTLIVNGNISTSLSTSVASGATLGGSGTVGATTISGTHSPGTSPGIISHSSLTYEDGANVIWELVANSTAGRSTNFDGINLTGALTFNGATTLGLDFDFGASAVEWQNTFWDTDYAGLSGWLIYSGATSLTGFSNLGLSAPATWLDESGDALTSIRSGASFSLFRDGNDIYLNYVAIPEPGAALIGSLGLLALLRRRR
jgi:autotransporter-associated beta strand protein